MRYAILIVLPLLGCSADSTRTSGKQDLAPVSIDAQRAAIIAEGQKFCVEHPTDPVCGFPPRGHHP